MAKDEEFRRQAAGTYAEVAAFLGGIFFTSLLVLVQQREKFDLVLWEISLKAFEIRITQLHAIAIPLSSSVIFFTFSSIFMAAAGMQRMEEFEKHRDTALSIFLLGFFRCLYPSLPFWFSSMFLLG